MDESFPLLFFGAACLVMAFVAFTTDTHVGSTRYPLWVLFLGLGSIAAIGGSAAVFVGYDDDEFLEEALADGSMVAVPKEELESLRRVAHRYEAMTGIHTPTVVRAGIVAGTAPGATVARSAMRFVPAAPAARSARSSAKTPSSPPAPWVELETDRETAAWMESGNLPEVATDPDEVDALLAELENPSTERSALPETLPPDDSAPVAEPRRSTASSSDVQAAASDFEAALRRMERSLPTAPPDPSDAWLDRAQLPQEFAHLLGELYPVERAGEPARSSARRPHLPTPGRCTNCGGRLTSSVGECSVCHGALCRTCEGLTSLTTDHAVCDRCSGAHEIAGTA